MMEQENRKNNFILYVDQYDAIKDLDDAQLGKLLRDFFEYAMTGETTETDPVIRAVFMFFKRQFDRNTERYNAICERNRTNGIKSNGRPPKKNPNKPNGLHENPMGYSGKTKANKKPNGLLQNPLVADNDNDKDKDNDKDNKRGLCAISDDPKLSAKTSFAPGGCTDDETIIKVINIYNRVFKGKKRQVKPDDINDVWRYNITYKVESLSNDMEKVESVFRDIANAPNLPKRNPSFADIVTGTAFVDYWFKYVDR